MSNKITFGELLSAFISQPIEAIKIMFILTLGEVGRWLYGGGRFRERAGDLIISLLLFYLIRPHIANLPPLFGTKISSGAIAISIALLGTHGISQLLIYTVKKRTGIDFSEQINKDKK
ncbi:hypothetical protein [Citrobacter youngae]|uniref:Uncharacterized protein n=1 Tax=Citrobacter youngae ATCC 29220 TaxID=500640 RepID=D4BBZ1_9ENTR|nr:hypothetical protein [Citrobacter youngae]EFE08609.1 hypothetical protein CIT292_07932 [Citrobacter youngae ATCC 29220]